MIKCQLYCFTGHEFKTRWGFLRNFYISEYFENVFNGQILHRLRIFKRWVKYILNMMHLSLYLKMFNTTWSDRKVWVESFSYVLNTIYQNMNKTNAAVSIIVRANPEEVTVLEF